MPHIVRVRVIGHLPLPTRDITCMKERFTHFEIRSFSNLASRGFTLIELMVVFALMGLIVAGGVVSYSSYNKKQGLQMGAAYDVNTLTSEKAKAISQVKPPECTGKTLGGYQVKITQSGSDYYLLVVCDGSPYPISSKRLPQDVRFGTGSTGTIMFSVSSGTSSTPGKIILTGGSDSKTVIIDGSGAIRTQ